jgi:hypothetical protein
MRRMHFSLQRHYLLSKRLYASPFIFPQRVHREGGLRSMKDEREGSHDSIERLSGSEFQFIPFVFTSKCPKSIFLQIQISHFTDI